MSQRSDPGSERARTGSHSRAASKQRSVHGPELTPQHPESFELEDRKRNEAQRIQKYIRDWRDREVEVTVKKPTSNDQEYTIMVIMKSRKKSPAMEESQFVRTGTDLSKVMDNADDEIRKMAMDELNYSLGALGELIGSGESRRREESQKREKSHREKDSPREKASPREKDSRAAGGPKSKARRMMEWLRKKGKQMRSNPKAKRLR